jgi:S1-C subfamily serine protease
MVTGYRQVNVIFKPTDPFGKPYNDDMVAAQVIKTDAMHDLALLRPKAVLPSHSINPIKVAPLDNIEVGADVHAIGRPTGEAWPYTTGIVSQIRPDYEWRIRVRRTFNIGQSLHGRARYGGLSRACA